MFSQKIAPGQMASSELRQMQTSDPVASFDIRRGDDSAFARLELGQSQPRARSSRWICAMRARSAFESGTAPSL
jgi:hypothetical protein